MRAPWPPAVRIADNPTAITLPGCRLPAPSRPQFTTGRHPASPTNEGLSTTNGAAPFGKTKKWSSPAWNLVGTGTIEGLPGAKSERNAQFVIVGLAGAVQSCPVLATEMPVPKPLTSVT